MSRKFSRPQVERIGAIALLGEPADHAMHIVSPGGRNDDMFAMHVEFFAQLSDGRRIETEVSYGSDVHHMHRRGLSALYLRYYGPPVDDLDQLDRDYRVRETDVTDAIKVALGKDRFETSPDQSRRDRHEQERWERRERRERWHALRHALKAHRIRLSVDELDALPFSIEISDELRAQLDYS